jgi:GNAT superfamily N-acetyltransferase
MSRTIRIAQELVTRQSALVDPADRLESTNLQALLVKLREEYPGLRLNAFEAPEKIELSEIEVKDKGQGVGTRVIREIQEYARQVNKPIVLRPHPEPRKKKALLNFYKSLGFVQNKGRNTDYTLSSPFSPTMYWRAR